MVVVVVHKLARVGCRNVSPLQRSAMQQRNNRLKQCLYPLSIYPSLLLENQECSITLPVSLAWPGSWPSSDVVMQWQWVPFVLGLGAYPAPPGSVRDTTVTNLGTLGSWRIIKQSVLAMMHEAVWWIQYSHFTPLTSQIIQRNGAW